MKQLIIMISMVILGIAIGGLVLNFQSTATSIANNTSAEILRSVTTGAIN